MGIRTIAVEMFVHEDDVTKLYRKLQDTFPATRWDKISIGHCGWANAPDCWWVRFPAKTDERKEIVDWVIESGIELYNPSLIY